MVEGTVIARGPQGYNWLHFVVRFEVVSIFFFTSIMTYYVFVKIGAFTIFRQLKTKAWYTALRIIWLQVEEWSFTLVALLAFHVFLEKNERKKALLLKTSNQHIKNGYALFHLNCLLSEEFRIKIIYKFYKYPNIAMGHCYCYRKYCYWILLLLLHCYWNITTEYKRVLIRVSSTFDNLETGGFALE